MALIEIHEDRHEQSGNVDYTKLMTPEQQRRGEHYAEQYWVRRGEVDSKYKNDWDYLQKLYECRRDADPEDPDYPNNFVPLITPTVEGQVASMLESNIDFKHISDNPAHMDYMRKFDAASEYYRRKTKFKQHFKDHARYYDLLGNCWVTISWQKMYGKCETGPKGLPRIEVPPLLSVLVDGTIKDVKDLQFARYIIREIGYMPIGWARDKYGDAYADALLAGFNRQEGDDPDISSNDSESFMLLHVWTRDNEYENLQLIEMDANGLVFRESDPSKPYYKHVNNEYPFAVSRMIPQLGKFYGTGDGNILRPLQECVNNLTDELELAARFSAQSKMVIDPRANMDDGQLSSNPADIIFAKSPRENILVIPGTGVNNVVLQTITYMLQQAQQATRFHDIMTGNQQGSSATATQITSQITQGSVGIKDKKSDIAETMAWADMYALKLCMQYWDKPFWASIGDAYSEHIDAEGLEEVPTAVPITDKTMKEYEKRAKSDKNIQDIPYWEPATDKAGKMILQAIDFETKVIIGEAIPKGRIDMYNILLGLSQIQLMNEDGTPEPLISPERLRTLMEDILGMKLRTPEEDISKRQSQNQVFDQELLNQINAIGQGNLAQTPQVAPQQVPDNLQQTVPQQPNRDSRNVVM